MSSGGVLLVAKPRGPTSHDIVDRARRALGITRIGHLGTLDPFAEGLLVLVTERATRLAGFAGGWTKSYDGRARVGVTTDTDDLTGKVLETSEAWRRLDRTDIERACARFVGGYDQRPPAYSAVKVDGERSYRRARRGEDVIVPPRWVEIQELTVTAWEPPEFGFRSSVSGGTYIRSLIRDIGEALQCGAHVTRLVRTRVGPFHLSDAVAIDAIASSALRGAEALVEGLPRRELDANEFDAVAHGRAIPASEAVQGDRIALFATGALVGIAETAVVDGAAVLKPRVVVAEP